MRCGGGGTARGARARSDTQGEAPHAEKGPQQEGATVRVGNSESGLQRRGGGEGAGERTWVGRRRGGAHVIATDFRDLNLIARHVAQHLLNTETLHIKTRRAVTAVPVLVTFAPNQESFLGRHGVIRACKKLPTTVLWGNGPTHRKPAIHGARDAVPFHWVCM